jgi:DNA repair exonuclease SbcCD ATPase subunit
MTTRERRERRAARRREWAESRAQKAAAAREGTDRIAGMIPMGQPILVGHHSEKRHRRDIERADNGMRRGLEHQAKAHEMSSRADNIEAAAERAIYSDDADAIERLEERIAELEATRTEMKRRNAEWLKANREAAKAMSAYERDRARPHAGYELTNLGGNISRTRKRLKALQRERQLEAEGKPTRTIHARRDGDCPRCDGRIQTGELISKIGSEWGHAECPGEE